jgi:AraC-like DNA-binding protein
VKEVEVIGYSHQAQINVFLNRIRYRMPHFHNVLEMSLSLEESSDWTILGQNHRIRPGDIVLLNPNQLHEIHAPGEACLNLYIQFPASLFTHTVPAMVDMHFDQTIIRPEDGPYYKSLRDLILAFTVLYLQKEESYPFPAISLFYLIMDQLISHVDHRFLSPEEAYKQKTEADRISRLMDFIQEGYTLPIKLQDFAEAEGLSLSYTSRFIKEKTNKTFQHLVKEYRLIRAQNLLITGKYSLTDLAYLAGFSDLRYMREAFLELLGTTPEAYALSPDEKSRLPINQATDSFSIEQKLSNEEAIRCLMPLLSDEKDSLRKIIEDYLMPFPYGPNEG